QRDERVHGAHSGSLRREGNWVRSGRRELAQLHVGARARRRDFREGLGVRARSPVPGRYLGFHVRELVALSSYCFCDDDTCASERLSGLLAGAQKSLHFGGKEMIRVVLFSFCLLALAGCSSSSSQNVSAAEFYGTLSVLGDSTNTATCTAVWQVGGVTG